MERERGTRKEGKRSGGVKGVKGGEEEKGRGEVKTEQREVRLEREERS